jgi:murein DD-endopeptidase MepM/ murein hydrolase activator NlpD
MSRAGRLAAAWLLALVATRAGAAAPGPELTLPVAVRPGELFVVRTAGGADPAREAGFLGKTYPALEVPGERGPLFLLGTDLEAPPGPHELVLRTAAGREERRTVTVRAHRFAEERLSLPPAMVTPPTEFEARILREQELAAEVYRTASVRKLWDRGFGRALAQPAAGNFGRRRVLNGNARSPHSGQDYTAPAGTPVRAIGAGRVRTCADWYYSGLTVLVDHGGGLVSQYLHLEKILVEEGAAVEEGQVIGRVGSTGRATGPHLHLGLRLFEQRVDPESLWGLFPPGKPAAPKPPAP